MVETAELPKGIPVTVEASPERSDVVPRFVTVSTPEEQYLPYRVDIDPQKTGAFMRSLGMTDKQIQDTTLTIAYETRGLAHLARPLDPLGYVNPFTGDLTINAHSIMRRTEFANKQFQRELKQGTTPEALKMELHTRRLARTFMGQIFPELLEPGQSQSLRKLSPVWRTKYANLAHEKGQEDRAKTFMEKHLARIMDHNLRLTVPHELIHVEQIKSGRHVRMAARAIPKMMGGVATGLAINLGIHALRFFVPAARIPLINTSLNIIGLTAYAGVYMKTISEGRKATGIEKEAYERMKLYDEVFTDIVRLTPVGEVNSQTVAPEGGLR